MGLTSIIQATVGLIVVWVILAAATSQIQEWIASIFSWRASLLEYAIAQMLGTDLKNKLYYHPLIMGLYSNNGKRKPGSIPADIFALVLIEAMMNASLNVGEVKNDFEKLKKSLVTLKASDIRELLNFATSLDTLLIGVEDRVDYATNAITEARMRVERWFMNSLDQLGGAYRRRMQIVAIIVGISIAAALNMDTLAIANYLWRDPLIRQAVVTQASQLQEPGQSPNAAEIVQNVENLNVLSLPIGWSPKNIPTDANGWFAKIIGILLSGMAAAQGAPYWFDLWRKLVTRNPQVPPQPA